MKENDIIDVRSIRRAFAEDDRENTKVEEKTTCSVSISL